MYKIVQITLSLVFKVWFCGGNGLHCKLLTYFLGERSKALWALLFKLYMDEM